MKKMVLIALLMMCAFVNAAFAEAIDISAMTDDELKALNARIESELLRRHNERSTNAVQEDDGEVIYVNDGEGVTKIIFESEEQLKNRLHKIELTTENWNQYLGDFYYPYEVVQKNNFGEVTFYEELRAVGFGFKEGYIGNFRNVAMKFSGSSRYSMEDEVAERNRLLFAGDKWKESNEVWSQDFYGTAKFDVHLEDYECLATTGTIVVLEVDPEASRWLLANPNKSWVDIYIGDQDYCDSDGLWHVYEKLNQ